MTTAHLSFKQCSYAKCQVCNETMYSWNSRNVPIFTLWSASKSETPSTTKPPMKPWKQRREYLKAKQKA